VSSTCASEQELPLRRWVQVRSRYCTGRCASQSGTRSGSGSGSGRWVPVRAGAVPLGMGGARYGNPGLLHRGRGGVRKGSCTKDPCRKVENRVGSSDAVREGEGREGGESGFCGDGGWRTGWYRFEGVWGWGEWKEKWESVRMGRVVRKGGWARAIGDVRGQERLEMWKKVGDSVSGRN